MKCAPDCHAAGDPWRPEPEPIRTVIGARSATQMQYTQVMKSALIPQVRVDPELRAELEAVLKQGETLSEFVLASVRSAAETRRVQQRFHERGQAAWEHCQRTGESVPAQDVLAKLQAKLDLRRKQLGG